MDATCQTAVADGQGAPSAVMAERRATMKSPEAGFGDGDIQIEGSAPSVGETRKPWYEMSLKEVSIDVYGLMTEDEDPEMEQDTNRGGPSDQEHANDGDVNMEGYPSGNDHLCGAGESTGEDLLAQYRGEEFLVYRRNDDVYKRDTGEGESCGISDDEDNSNGDGAPGAETGYTYSHEKLMRFIDFTGLHRPTRSLTSDPAYDKELFELMQLNGSEPERALEVDPLDSTRTMACLKEILDAHRECQRHLVLRGPGAWLEAMKEKLIWFFPEELRGDGIGAWLLKTVYCVYPGFYEGNNEMALSDPRARLLYETIDGLRHLRLSYLATLPQDQPSLTAESSPFLVAVHRCTEHLAMLGPDFTKVERTSLEMVPKTVYEIGIDPFPEFHDLRLRRPERRVRTGDSPWDQALLTVKYHALLVGSWSDDLPAAQKWHKLWHELTEGSLQMFSDDPLRDRARYEGYRTWAAQDQYVVLPQLQILPTHINNHIDWMGMMQPMGDDWEDSHARGISEMVYANLKRRGLPYSTPTVNQYFCPQSAKVGMDGPGGGLRGGSKLLPSSNKKGS